MTVLAGERRRAGYVAANLADQALSSLTNLAPAIYAAHLLSPAGFGVFALVQLAYVLALGLLRSVVVEPAVVLSGQAADRDAARRLLRGAIDVVGVLVLALAALAAVVWWVFGTPATPAVLLLPVVVTCMLLQDAFRLVSIAERRMSVAIVNDLLWLVTALALLVVLHVTLPGAGASTLAFVWAASSVPGVLVAAGCHGWLPSWRRGRALAGAASGLSRSFGGDWLLTQGVSQVLVAAVAAVSGVRALAGIRAAQLVLGPLNVLFSGIHLAALPRLAARADGARGAVRRDVSLMATLLTVAPLVLAAAALLLPDRVVALLLGDQVQVLAPYLPPLAVTLAASGYVAAHSTGLRALAAGAVLLRSRLGSSTVTLVGGVVGLALTRDAVGTLWGLALGTAAGGALWRRAFCGVVSPGRGTGPEPRP